MGKKGKKAAAGKPKKLTPKDVSKRLDSLIKKLEEELKGADLFAPLPPTEDCIICFLPLSRIPPKSIYMCCCGKLICKGYYEENEQVVNKQNEDKGAKKEITLMCPFCRVPTPSPGKEYLNLLEARAARNDPVALHQLGGIHMEGQHGLPQNDLKALDYLIRAADLGSAAACISIASCYDDERTSVRFDQKMPGLFEQVAAVRGDIEARHNLGKFEYDSGNHEIGIRHWKISAEAGMQASLNNLRRVYNAGGKMPGKEFIAKDELDRLYRVCHVAQEEVKSEEREKHCDLEHYDEAKC